MKKSYLIKKAVNDYYWYIKNVSTDRYSAIIYAQSVYDHALYCGYITEEEHKRLCLGLPFETYIK